ncbi:MAG: thiamine-binding protein [Actinomycetia bacterium]|nr:thiamine-binding protein [Actinomycetes bacterium]
MSECTVSFTIEPFNENDPGQHVMSGIRAMESSGLTVSMGPFGSTVVGSVHEVSPAIGAMVTAAVHDGADRVLVEVEIDQP